MVDRVRILIAHRDDAMRRSTSGALDGVAMLEVIDEVGDLATLGRLMAEVRPDVVLLDPELVPTSRHPAEPDPLASLSRSAEIVILSPAASRLLAAIGIDRVACQHHRDKFGLTARERDVMGLVSTGADNAAISDALYIAPKTVKNHIGRVFAKLGVNSRAEAVAAWLGTRPDRFPDVTTRTGSRA